MKRILLASAAILALTGIAGAQEAPEYQSQLAAIASGVAYNGHATPGGGVDRMGVDRLKTGSIRTAQNKGDRDDYGRGVPVTPFDIHSGR